MTPPEHLENLSPAKRALYEIRSLRSRVEELERQREEPVAIVGIGLRFPGGASTPDAFWQLMTDGIDSITEVPASRWPVDRFYDSNPDAPGKMYTRTGAFLENPDLFDAAFFGISPREAVTMDPQHRLALEVAWEALEHAGANPAGLTGTPTGVFLALSNSDYARMVFGRLNELDAYAGTGNIFSVAAGRISFMLGLEGPSMAVDTACSGSLVAVHLACQSLRAGESDLALAGGANLILSPEISVNFSKSRMMAPDGKCKTFDAAADGYVRGEGCGIVVLKRLSDALAARDRILALIRGSAVNQDGRSSGLTAPNGSAQQAVIRQALAAAGVQPHEIDYVEAHGTGTSLGDPIEAHALAAALGPGRHSANPLLIGSVKTNIGHLESAAGVAGLIKTVLALQHGQIPRHLHFQQLNPHIDWAGVPVEIPVQTKPWPRADRRRLAGVSSFGFSGTNAHVIVEEAPLSNPPERPSERPLHLLALSARSPEALTTLAERYATNLATSEDDLGGICYTANAGRAQLDERAWYLAATRQEMLESLRRGPANRGQKQTASEIVFLFPGQGAQFPGMGKELYDTHPEFRRTLDECAELLREELPAPLLELLWGAHTELLDETRYTQPALFALEYALAQLWRSWGIQPSAVLGHSVGEYVAACFAGVYSLADGLKLIAGRARLMQHVPGNGVMTAVMAPESTVRQAIAGLESQVRIAALNAPESIVISGYLETIEIAETRLRDASVRTRRLNVSHAFHSPQMAAMEHAFVELVKTIRFQTPRVELISSVTGKPVGNSEMSDPEYWRRQVSEPVRFAAAMETLGAKGYGAYVEVGPGSTLSGLGKQSVTSPDLSWTPSLRENRGAWQQMLESLGQLWARGAEVDWAAFDRPYHRGKVSLPTYPFERQSYWLEERPSTSTVDDNATWHSICEHAAQEAGRGRLDFHLDEYPQRWASLDRLVSGSVLAAWQTLGVFQTAGERHTVESLVERAGIRTGLNKMIGWWLEQFTAHGLLLQAGDSYIAAHSLAVPALEPLISTVRSAFSSDHAIAEYVIDCARRLPALLTGRESPLSVLFPEGSLARAEDVYERSAFSAYFASIVRGALDGLLRYRPDCSLIEIGAGTGGTTSAVLPLLPPNAVYHFTDVSAVFLSHAERKFTPYPQMRYGLLDIERDPAEQGYPADGFDVVIATNVLHATRDIGETLLHVDSLLAPGGVLLLCETTAYLSWLDITVGLTEGWPRSDDSVRGGKPLLPEDQWQSLLAEHGFDRIASYPAAGAPTEILGEHVFIARKPGTRAVSLIPHASTSTQSAREVSDRADAETNELRNAPPVQRHDLLVALLRREIAALLRYSGSGQIDRKRRLTDLGLDSLMSLELRTRLTTTLRPQSPLSPTLVFDCPTLDSLAEYLNREVFGFEPAAEPRDEANDALSDEAERLEDMDDDEVAALLVQKLKAL